MIDQPLGQRTRQHQLTLGHGDEGVAQPVEPEPRAGGLADFTMEVSNARDVARPALRRREHPALRLCR